MFGLKHLTVRLVGAAWNSQYRMFALGYVHKPYTFWRSGCLFGFEFNTNGDYGMVDFGGFKLTRLDLFYMRWEWEPEGVDKVGTSIGEEYRDWSEAHGGGDRGDTVG